MYQWSWGCALNQQKKLSRITAKIWSCIWTCAVCSGIFWSPQRGVCAGLALCWGEEGVSHTHRVTASHSPPAWTDVLLCMTKISLLWILRLWGIPFSKSSFASHIYRRLLALGAPDCYRQINSLHALGFMQMLQKKKDIFHKYRPIHCSLFFSHMLIFSFLLLDLIAFPSNLLSSLLSKIKHNTWALALVLSLIFFFS